jgi:hypothetical protein
MGENNRTEVNSSISVRIPDLPGIVGLEWVVADDRRSRDLAAVDPPP